MISIETDEFPEGRDDLREPVVDGRVDEIMDQSVEKDLEHPQSLGDDLRVFGPQGGQERFHHEAHLRGQGREGDGQGQTDLDEEVSEALVCVDEGVESPEQFRQEGQELMDVVVGSGDGIALEEQLQQVKVVERGGDVDCIAETGLDDEGDVGLEH